MIALFVILTFAAMVLIDHLILRQPIVIAEEAPRSEKAPRARFAQFVSGFEVPEAVKFHPGHTWAIAESTDRVRVGIDDFAKKLAGTVTRIEIPERGQWIRQGQKIIALHSQGRELDLVSPIEGTVLDINDAVLRDPARLAEPYGDGWLIAVNAPDAKTNFRNLLGGTVARKWMDDAAAKFRSYMPAEMAMAQDGGVALDDTLNHLPAEKWTAIERELFLL
jgi:glycine cleavage system H protein